MGAPRHVIALLTAMSCGVVVVTGATASPEQQDRPSLSPIQATFNQAESLTRYTVSLDDPGAGPETPIPDWQWVLTPPADDPTCRFFAVVDRQKLSSAAYWGHSDRDGCKHLGTDHAGRIDLTVKTRGYTCYATITGTTTHEGPEPELCFKSTPPAPPPPSSSSAPSLTDLEKKRWLEESKLWTAGGVTFIGLAIGCALVPEPAASKGVAVFGLIVGMGYYAMAGYAFYKAEDPPDRNYKRLTKLVVPRVPVVRAGPGITPAEAAAVNALLAAVARIVANDVAFITSFERAQGAYAARNGTWDRRQSRAAAAFARAEAKLLDGLPRLEAALSSAVAKASVPPLRAEVLRRALEGVSEQGLPPALTTVAARFGVDRTAAEALRTLVERAGAGGIAGPVAPRFASPRIARADRTAAQLLRAVASRLDKR